jgi:glycosyltransferase involved in cell wall biosynthesis
MDSRSSNVTKVIVVWVDGTYHHCEGIGWQIFVLPSGLIDNDRRSVFGIDMRILLFIHSLTGAGAERVTANLANSWAAAGLDVVVVTAAPQSEDAFALDPRVRRISFDMPGVGSGLIDGVARTVERARRLRAVLREVRPDVAIGIMNVASVILALAARGLKDLRSIGTEHNFPGRDPLDPVRSLLRRYTYGWLDSVVVLTQESADWIRAHTAARTIRVIPNAAQWPLPCSEPRVEPSRPEGRRRIVAVGRLTPQKGFERLVEAFSRVSDQHPRWDVVILGDGPDRVELEELVRARGLTDRFRLAGWAGNIGEWYENSDIFALSSRYEGFPCALAEAMAHGVPAVSFDCDTGPRDIVRDGIDGLLVRADDVTALADSLDRLMSDEALRARFAVCAVESRARFSKERILAEWARLFEDLAVCRATSVLSASASPGA